MNIGNYYLNKRQIAITVVLILGLAVAVYLVQNRQIFKSRAAYVNKTFDLSQGNTEPRPVVNCDNDNCTTSSLDIFLKPKRLDNQPTAPVAAVITVPTSKPSTRVDNRIGYHIPFRDTSVSVADPEAIKKRIVNSWPSAQIDNFDTIVNKSRESNWNPAFVLTIWIEESGAQGNAGGYSAALGCDVNHTKYSGTKIEDQLTCLFNNFSEYQDNQFADFMCRFATGSYTPCNFSANHPYFLNTISSVYSELVPSGPGALVR